MQFESYLWLFACILAKCTTPHFLFVIGCCITYGHTRCFDDESTVQDCASIFALVTMISSVQVFKITSFLNLHVYLDSQ